MTEKLYVSIWKKRTLANGEKCSGASKERTVMSSENNRQRHNADVLLKQKWPLQPNHIIQVVKFNFMMMRIMIMKRSWMIIILFLQMVRMK